MNARTKKIFDEALELPAEDRARLAGELEASLLGEGAAEDEQKAWAAEIERRIDGVVSGRVKTRDLREAMAELRARYARR